VIASTSFLIISTPSRGQGDPHLSDRLSHLVQNDVIPGLHGVGSFFLFGSQFAIILPDNHQNFAEADNDSHQNQNSDVLGLSNCRQKNRRVHSRPDRLIKP
jgi:hypothetical protein